MAQFQVLCDHVSLSYGTGGDKGDGFGYDFSYGRADGQCLGEVYGPGDGYGGGTSDTYSTGDPLGEGDIYICNLLTDKL